MLQNYFFKPVKGNESTDAISDKIFADLKNYMINPFKIKNLKKMKKG